MVVVSPVSGSVLSTYAMQMVYSYAVQGLRAIVTGDLEIHACMTVLPARPVLCRESVLRRRDKSFCSSLVVSRVFLVLESRF